VPTDLPALESKKSSLAAQLKDQQKLLEQNKKALTTKKATLDDLTKKMSEISGDELLKAHKKYTDNQKQLTDANRRCELKKSTVKNKLDKLKKLQEYKYDPKCKFCVENIFVKDAKKTEAEIDADKSELQTIENEVASLKKQHEEWNWIEEAYTNYNNLHNSLQEAKTTHASAGTLVYMGEMNVEGFVQSLKDVENKIDLYHKNEQAVITNRSIDAIIWGYKQDLKKVDGELSIKNRQLIDLSGKKEVLKQKIHTISKTALDVINIEEELELYEYYTKAMSRDGIPYQIICNTLPAITNEINSILTQIADFTIELEFDEKSIIPNVCYETKGKWPIESLSGFERFVTSIAIRVALNGVSNLPKCPVIMIDEGFSSLDKNNLTAMPIMFDYLKHHYNIVVVISHNETIRDFVDKQLEIVQQKGFSKLVFA
jgi:DNA repair exonuclease SbcCD ATPase subunit